MKLNDETITFLQNVVKTAQLVGIDNIIIEPEAIRAIDENKTVVMFEKDVPPLPFDSIGLNRVGVFASRLGVVQPRDGFSVDATVDGSKQVVSLLMKSTDVKVEYRCANPTSIKAPKRINDIPKFQIPLNAEAVMLLMKGQAAMGSEHVTIKHTTNGVSFELADSNGDVFSHTFTEVVKLLTEKDYFMFIIHNIHHKIKYYQVCEVVE